MREATGLGASTQTEGSLVSVDRSGDVLLVDRDAGRVWRRTPFYTFPDWGVWVTDSFKGATDWDTDAECIGVMPYAAGQSGDCDGSERQRDGTIPEGWSFHHGGFADGMPGVRAGLFHDEARVVILVGEVDGAGVAYVLDAGVEDSAADTSSYDFLSAPRAVEGELPAGLVPWGTRLLDPDTGRIWAVEGLDSTGPKAIERGEVPVPEIVGQGVLVADGDAHLVSGEVIPVLGRPVTVATDGEVVWTAGDELAWSDGTDGEVFDLPHDVDFLVADALDGLHAAWVVCAEALYLAGPEGLADTGLRFPATPIAATLDAAPHDLVLAFAAGPEGCDGDWAEHCVDGEHPALLWAGYPIEALENIESPVNLFLAPVLESPVDGRIDTDWTLGESGCIEAFDEDRDRGCCALSWSIHNRLNPNLDYLGELDRPTLLGVNPSVLLQAELCADSGFSDVRVDLAEALQGAVDDGIELSHWTHTPHDHPEGFEARFVEGLVDLPIDDQAEYVVFQQSMRDFELPAEPAVCAGNSADGLTMDWDDASWVEAIRDAGEFEFHYFGLAGGVPDVGDNGFRKKEQFPLDIRDRLEVFEMGAGVDDWYTSGDSGMFYLPGTTWLVNALDPMAYGGVWRESQRWGVELVPNDWTLLNRYLFRMVRSSDPAATKSWYIHLYDITHPDPTLQELAGSPDANVEGLAEIDAVLVSSGAARWVHASAIDP